MLRSIVAIEIRNILVPLDGSKNSLRGLDRAISLARQCRATITGVYVKQMPGVYAIHPMGFLDFGSLTDAKRFLESAKIRAAKKGVDLEGRIIAGDPGHDLVRFSEKKSNGIDAIVIGARGRGSAKEIFLGSTSNHVLHKSKKPVMIVR